MEPPAAKKPKKLAAGLAAGARKPAALAAGASKPAAASAHKPKAKPQKVRGDLAVVVAARAVQQHLEKFQRPFTAAQLWENTQKVVAKKEIVPPVRAQKSPSRVSIRQGAAEQFRDGITPRRRLRAPRRGGRHLCGNQNFTASRRWRGAVGSSPPEPVAMARKHGDFVKPGAPCDVDFHTCYRRRSATRRRPTPRPRSSKSARRLLREEPTNEELDALLREAEAASSQEHRVDDATLAARVSVLSSGTFVTPEELRAAQEKHDAYLAKWKRLRRVVMDACARVGESCDDDVDLAHLAGVFTDEEAGVRAVPGH